MTTALSVTLLGTGSPAPSLDRRQPAALVTWGEDSAMLVDAGDGVVGQLLAADTELAKVEHVAFTHLHWDHVLGYPGFVWGGWHAGRRRLRVIGPAGTSRMHERLVEGYFRDQAEWAIGLGYSRTGWEDVRVVDVGPGWSADVDGCRVQAGAVVHPPMAALGYRFSHGGRSLVISGDTVRCETLIELARGADLLIADACAAPPPPDAAPAARELAVRLHDIHASPQDCVEIAAEAGVRRVVLTHHRPGAEFALDLDGYDGEVLMGSDLDLITA